jgi:hypothetical protein
MNTVHIRINDSATGKPTPVRLRITGPDGTYYAPLGRAVEFPTGRNEVVGGQVKLGSERWFYIEGSCEIELPTEVPLRVQATLGPEYKPLDKTVTLGPGQMALRFTIEIFYDWRVSSWHPGDIRCHFLTPHTALLEAMAEDLDVVNLLATPQPFPSLDGTAYTTVPNLLAFSGQQPSLSAERWHSVAVNTLNTHPVLGKVALLHSHRPVFPLTFGGEESDDWGICDWCDQCHRKKGLTVWVDAFEPAGGVIGGEALVAAILGKIDAIEVTPEARKVPLLPWVYRLWNAGFPIPLAGGSGKDSNKIALGAMRTYTWVPGDFSPAGWIEGVRTGQSFVTTGPLFEFEVNGHQAGEVVDTSEPITISADAESLTPFDKLELIANGEVIASAASEFIEHHGDWALREKLEVPFTPTASSWLAARCVGKNGFAHTSPVIVRVADQPLPRQPEAVAALKKLIDQTREWVVQHGRYTNPKRREQLLERCAEAHAKLEPGP